MLTPSAGLRRLAACWAALVGCATLAISTGQPVAHAADGREMLESAIGTTKGSYLVYNFGSGHPMPMLNAAGSWYDSNNGGHLLVIKNAAGRLSPHLLVDTHQGAQARCERNPGARTSEGLLQASELYEPRQAWQRMGEPTVAINANFFDVRGQKGGSWRTTGCSSPLGAFVDNTHGQGRANEAVTGTVAYPGKQGLSGGGESWSTLTTMILPSGGAPYVVWPRSKTDYDSATPVIAGLAQQERQVRRGVRDRAVVPRLTPSSCMTRVEARRELPWPTRSRRTRCTYSRAATTPRTTFRTCSGAWVAIPRSCSTAVDRRPLCCAATPGACGPAPGRRRVPATPGRCCATLMNADYPAGSRSTSREQAQQQQFSD